MSELLFPKMENKNSLVQLALLTLKFDQLVSIAGKHDPYSRRAQRLKAKTPHLETRKASFTEFSRIYPGINVSAPFL